MVSLIVSISCTFAYTKQFLYIGQHGGVETSRVEVVLDGISPSRFGATSWCFPAMNYWVEFVDPSYREGGCHAMEMSEPA